MIMAHSPTELFFEWLSERPGPTRMAVAVDGDRLLADAELLGKERLNDNAGREWRVVVFRGDDISFRRAYRHARSEKHVLVILARSMSADSRINVSYLTDILALNEGGTPLDLSVPAVFRELCPKINFPVPELRRFKDRLLDRIADVPAAAKKIIERWGRPDDWGRGQVAALVLLVHHPDWSLTDIWPDELDPAAAIAHALRVLWSVPSNSPDLPIVRELLHEAARPQVKDHLFWINQSVEEIAAYLLIRKFAADAKLQNPVVQLNGLQVFPIELPLEKLEPLARKVIAQLQADPVAWRALEKHAEEFITPRCSEKLGSVISSHPQETDAAILTSPALLLPYVQRRLLEFFAAHQPDAQAREKEAEDGNGPSLARRASVDLAWVSECHSNPAVMDDDDYLSDRRKQCQALVRLAGRVHQIENRLTETVPQFDHADQMLDWYVNGGHHILELEAARSLHDWHECDDEKLRDAAGHYLLGGDDEVAPARGSLVQRVRQRLDELDLTLSKFIAAAPDKFASGPRSFVSFIKDELGDDLQAILTGDSDRRVWILIFDGMRYDTWSSVIQPLLGEDFQISGQARFCTLPSYTLYARRSVLAGAPPSEWVTGKNPASRPEAQLFAENVGLAKHEIKDKLRLVTDADTTKARTAMTFQDKNAKPLNILIYPISDECHDYRGDLAAFNSKIRQDLLGDRNTGIRGILDDLLRRVKPGDIILATSDHGFVELPPDSAVTVTEREADSHQVTLKDTVHYRYAKHFTPAQLPATVKVDVANEPHSLCVGRTWLKREGVGNTARYSHGGVSFSELVVPAVRLERVTEKQASVVLSNLPSAVAVDEDQEVEVTFTVRNQGNVDAEFDVTVRSNLDQLLLEQHGSLSPAGSQSLTIHVVGAYRTRAGGDTDSKGTLSAIGIRLKHTDQAGKWRDAVDGSINIPVKVHAKKTKLTTDALAGFDDV